MKLDLHTHCHEAVMSRPASHEVVDKIVDRIKQAGLDGIAITDHDDAEFARQAVRLLEESKDSGVVLIPGREVARGPMDIVELYLPGGTTFRFLAHPPAYSYPWEEHLDGLHGIEIENGYWTIDRGRVQAAADRFGLITLRNSDAHSLFHIGRYYNEVSLDELVARASRGPGKA